MAQTRKLIEVALPLKEINDAAKREKGTTWYGHPSTLHIWWARRPLAVARAVLFAQLVDDPSSHPEKFPTEEAQAKERERLFDIIRELVKWENSSNAAVLERAAREIRRSTGGSPPDVFDPFCGGGTIPLEAQRLGLSAIGSDLNPVAVLLTKALVEIPPHFRDQPPVHPKQGQQGRITESSPGASGLAEDIRYYGDWMHQQAWEKIGKLYPKVQLPKEQGGGEATVIAWLWARTVASPNPALKGAHVPLVRSFVLSSRKGHEAWVEPVADRVAGTYRFEVRQGSGAPKGTVDRRGARCIITGEPIPLEYIRAEGKAGRLRARLLAVVAEGARGRTYVNPDEGHEHTALSASPPWLPAGELAADPRAITAPNYGMATFADLFASRQLVALTTFSDLIPKVREEVLKDALATGMMDDGLPLAEGGHGAQAYADAIATYLALAVDKGADYWSSICSWHTSNEQITHTFARQAIPMVWDYAEANPFSESSGNWLGAFTWVSKAVAAAPARGEGLILQQDARMGGHVVDLCISTDPPYYDNIGYADLSDFFYVWLRRSLKDIHPDLFATLLVPKADELVATPYRFGGSRDRAREHFEKGLHAAFTRLREASHPDFPLTVYYAFKQSEDEGYENGEDLGTASTGWETMLDGLIQAGFAILGTWPMRTERGTRPRGQGSNALASSVVLVCRPRPEDAPQSRRRDFQDRLQEELPSALKTLQQGGIAPVDLAQSTIGPGMAIFSRYRRVLEADGSAMPVRTALLLINQVLDTFFAEQEGEFDQETRWALSWFDQQGYREGLYGDAESLSKAKDVGLGRLVEHGVLSAQRGKVRLLRPQELLGKNPSPHPTAWEAVQHLAGAIASGEEAAADAYQKLGAAASELARDLAYRLYALCERQGWAEEALPYNMLVSSWHGITALVEQRRRRRDDGLRQGEIAP